MQAFIVSVFAGCLFPILPIIAELGLTNAVQSETPLLRGVGVGWSGLTPPPLGGHSCMLKQGYLPLMR
jgi:hypothetical protein